MILILVSGPASEAYIASGMQRNGWLDRGYECTLGTLDVEVLLLTACRLVHGNLVGNEHLTGI